MPLDDGLFPSGVIPQAVKRRDRKSLMPPDELKDIIRREAGQALGYPNGKLASERMEALSYYQGGEFASPPPGQNRSRVVMLTVLETVEWVLPALLRIFTASPNVAELTPTQTVQHPAGPQMAGQPPPLDPEEAARQSTAYVNHICTVDNPWLLILHDWFKDALLQKVGWVKRWWDVSKIRETNSFTGLTEAEYQAMLTDLDKPDGSSTVEILEEHSYPAPQPEGFNQDAPNFGSPMLYDCKLRVTRKQGRIRIANVPPEEVLFSRRCNRDYMPFIQHRQPMTTTQLLDLGYDEECLTAVGWSDSDDYNAERLQRHKTDDDFPYSNDRTDMPMRTFWYEESYVLADYDGDGVAELLKVATVNNAATILTKDGEPDIEEIDEVPLVYCCPVPMPHKLVGLSVADLVMDLQRIKSTLVRQMLDNLYLANNPRHLVVEGAATEATYDDLLQSKPGGIVRTRTPDGVTPLVTPFVAEKAMGMVEYVDQTAEVRTGISRHNQGLDPEALNKTATGVQLIQAAAQQRVELIARLFAFSVEKLVRGILGLIRKHQQEERIIHVTGGFLQLDPRQWKSEMNVACSVGLGSGNRDQILSHLMALFNLQSQIVQGQAAGMIPQPIVYPKNIYDVVQRLTQNAGFRESYVTDPTVPPPPSVAGPPTPPKPDPQAQQAQAMAQAEIQIMQAKAQTDAQLQQSKAQHQAQLAQQKAQQDMTIAQQRAEHDLMLQQKKLENEFALEQQKQAHDMEIERLKAANSMEVERMKTQNAHEVAMHQASLAAANEASA